MMAHVEIALKIVTLLAGVWAAVYAVQMSRSYSYAFLQPLVLFVLFHNLIVAASLATSYCCANIMGNCLLYQNSLVRALLHPCAAFFMICRTGALILLLFGFQDKDILSRNKPWLVAGAGILALSYAAALAGAVRRFSLGWLEILHEGLYAAAVFLLYAGLCYLVITGFLQRDAERRKLFLSFGVFFLAFQGLLVATALFPVAPRIVTVALVMLLFNLFPILWLRRFFLPFHRKTVSVIEDSQILEMIYKEHNITKREQEIAALILKGKTNSDIHKMLFISVNTVKNHIYSLFQKTSVSNRWQFVQLVIDSQSRLRERRRGG